MISDVPNAHQPSESLLASTPVQKNHLPLKEGQPQIRPLEGRTLIFCLD